MKKSFVLIFVVFLASVYAADVESISVWSEQTYPGIVEAGDQNVSLHVTMINNANRAFNDITLTANFQEPFTAVSDTYFLGTMESAERFTAVFVFDVGVATSGAYTIPLQLKYYDQGSLTLTAKEVHISISSEPQFELKDLETVVEPGKFKEISFTM